MKYLQKNFYLILLICSFVSIVLLAQNELSLTWFFINHSDYSYTKENIKIVENSLYCICAVLLFLIAYQKSLKKTYVIVAIILFYVAGSIPYLINIKNYVAWLPTIAFHICTVALSCEALKNKRTNIISILFLFADTAFTFCNVMTGSTAALGCFLITSMFIIIILVATYSEEQEYNNTFTN